MLIYEYILITLFKIFNNKIYILLVEKINRREDYEIKDFK